MRKILIGYAMRSGSTLLQQMLGEHSRLHSYSDLTSYPILFKFRTGMPVSEDLCVKPMDLFYLWESSFLYEDFNKFLWLARDPRDSYLSSIESGYAYLFWPHGKREEDVDVGLLERWKRIYQHYFGHRDIWRLIKYEMLVTEPERTLRDVFDYLELPFEKEVLHFEKFNLLKGGDYKIRRSSTVHDQSVGRYRRELSLAQLRVFEAHLGAEMKALGYL